jgi:hypothetical protein
MSYLLINTLLLAALRRRKTWRGNVSPHRTGEALGFDGVERSRELPIPHRGWKIDEVCV